MYLYCFPDKEQALHKSQVLVKESPYAQMSGSSNKTLYVLNNISNNFFVGTEVS